MNLTTKLVVGEKVQESIYENVLNDARHSPRVPQNVIKDGVGKGCGVAEIPGKETCVYKAYYEDDKAHGLEWSDVLRNRLQGIRPAPGNMTQGHLSWDEIVSMVPAAADKPDDGMIDDDGDDSRLAVEGGFGVDGRDVADHDAPLRGAARAAHASRVTADVHQFSAAEAARRTARELAEDGM